MGARPSGISSAIPACWHHVLLLPGIAADLELFQGFAQLRDRVHRGLQCLDHGLECRDFRSLFRIVQAPQHPLQEALCSAQRAFWWPCTAEDALQGTQFI